MINRLAVEHTMRIKTVFTGVVVNAFILLGILVCLPAKATVPKDIFVMATQLDEFSTLDPAEVYELVPTEYIANTYDRLVRVDLRDPSRINGEVAQSWQVGPDGRTFTFKIRPGLKFHSGNPLTAADVAFSIQRVVLLNKSPASVLQSLGLSADKVREQVKEIDASTVTLQTDRKYAPSFVLNVLGSWVGSIVDQKQLTAHQQGDDLGNGWLKTHEAGSGPFQLISWTANESVVLQRFDGYRQPSQMKRVILRHAPESASQRLLLESADVDAARQLSPEDIDALTKNKKAKRIEVPTATVFYLGLNTKNPKLAQPDVWEAFKWLIDYRAMEMHLLKGAYTVHQNFLPTGMLGSSGENPYRQNITRAKALLKKAGFPDGFTVTMDVTNVYPTNEIAQAVQADLAKGGITLELIPGDNKQTLARYRARQHDIFIGNWSADYLDPHSNAQGFLWNPDNSDRVNHKMLAWRNSWDTPVQTRQSEAALAEPSTARRVQQYKKMQQDMLQRSPFVIMFQKISQVAVRPELNGLEIGLTNDLVSYRGVTK